MRISCFITGILVVISTVLLAGCSGSQEMPSSFSGLWEHQSRRSEDKKLVLYINTDAKGRIYAQHFKQYYSYQPVFLDSDFENDELLLKFKLVTYYSGSKSKHEILYRLKNEDGKLIGQHCPSWKECRDVELTTSKN